MSKSIFVFGSNEAGIHGAGAARTAYKLHGAMWGFSYGHMGSSFAIPTKDEDLQTLSEATIFAYVQGFKAFTKGHRKLTFQVTRIGCGLAGLKDRDMAHNFMSAPTNCQFDEAWAPFMGGGYTYWGSYDK